MHFQLHFSIQFELSPFQTGLMFAIYGGVYMMSAPLLGWVCDRWQKPGCLIFIGSILIVCAFILIGPAPFVPMDTYEYKISTNCMNRYQ